MIRAATVCSMAVCLVIAGCRPRSVPPAPSVTSRPVTDLSRFSSAAAMGDGPVLVSSPLSSQRDAGQRRLAVFDFAKGQSPSSVLTTRTSSVHPVSPSVFLLNAVSEGLRICRIGPACSIDVVEVPAPNFFLGDVSVSPDGAFAVMVAVPLNGAESASLKLLNVSTGELSNLPGKPGRMKHGGRFLTSWLESQTILTLNEAGRIQTHRLGDTSNPPGIVDIDVPPKTVKIYGILEGDLVLARFATDTAAAAELWKGKQRIGLLDSPSGKDQVLLVPERGVAAIAGGAFVWQEVGRSELLTLPLPQSNAGLVEWRDGTGTRIGVLMEEGFYFFDLRAPANGLQRLNPR